MTTCLSITEYRRSNTAEEQLFFKFFEESEAVEEGEGDDDAEEDEDEDMEIEEELDEDDVGEDTLEDEIMKWSG